MPAMGNDQDVTRVARRLRDLIEPVVGQVYFAPECHAAYAALGFGPSSRRPGNVALPDGPAYFTSRGSCLGQVPGEVIAAAFAVFNPAVVAPGVAFGWSVTDAPEGLDRTTGLLRRATERLRPEGRALYAGLLALGLPGDPVGDMWRLGDLLREYRGDAHTAAWTSAGLDATEIGLLTELWWGIPMRTYVKTRAWTDEQLDGADHRLRGRGLIDGDGFTAAGRALRADIEAATDAQLVPAVTALRDDADELFAILEPWGAAIVAAGGYPGM
jgi:hypothetical protein